MQSVAPGQPQRPRQRREVPRGALRLGRSVRTALTLEGHREDDS